MKICQNTDRGEKMQEKKVTIYSLADELGVSVAAISRAFDPNSKLSAEKRKKILSTAKKYGYTPNKMASRLSMAPIKIGLLNFSYIKMYYTELLDGVQAAHQNLRDYKVELDIQVLQRGENTMEEALAILNNFLEKHYDGVIISGIYEDCVVEKINRLEDAGIRVVTLQYDVGESKRLFSSLGDYKVIGEMAAQLCGMLLRSSEGKKAVMFTGNKRSPTHSRLIESFCCAAKKYGVEIADIYDTQDNAACAERMIVQAFGDHPDIAVIYASSANSLPICQYLERNHIGQKVAFVASDVFPELYPYIECGIIDATIYQEPFKMGYTAFEKLFRVLSEGITVEEVITSTPRVVMASNLKNYR